MRKLLLLVAIAVNSLAFGQKKMITLKNEPIDFQLSGYYIENVIDGRQNQDDIGFVQVGLFNRKEKADLEGGVGQSIFNYLKNSLKMDTTLTPIVMRVVYLNISEQTNFASEYGKVEIKIEFYKKENNDLGKVYEAEAYIEEPGMDVTKAHERRIRKVIITCLKNFNNSKWQESSPIYERETQVAAEKINLSQTSLASIQKETPRWNSLLTFSQSLGVNAKGFSLSYYGYILDEKSDWLVPWVISVERFTLNQDYFDQSNYMEAQLGYTNIGVCALKKLGNDFYANLGLQIPLGSERLTDFNGHESNNFLIGLTPSQGIYYIPKSSFGITVGIGIYEKVLTSKVYKSDIGFKAEIGIKF